MKEMKGEREVERILAQTLIAVLCSLYARCFVYLRNVFANHKKNWHTHINCKICTAFCTYAYVLYVRTYARRANVSNSIITQPNCASNKKVHCQMKQVRKMHEYHHHHRHHHPCIHRSYCVIIQFWWSAEMIKMTLVKFTGSTMAIWLKNYIFTTRKLINGFQSISL